MCSLIKTKYSCGHEGDQKVDCSPLCGEVTATIRVKSDDPCGSCQADAAKK